MKRRMTEEDLRDKGLPFQCPNCGAKPTVDEVISHSGGCAVCGDEVIAYTFDTAKFIESARAKLPPVEKVRVLTMMDIASIVGLAQFGVSDKSKFYTVEEFTIEKVNLIAKMLRRSGVVVTDCGRPDGETEKPEKGGE